MQTLLRTYRVITREGATMTFIRVAENESMTASPQTINLHRRETAMKRKAVWEDHGYSGLQIQDCDSVGRPLKTHHQTTED